MGEEVGAFIKLKDANESITRDEIAEFCKGNLAHFKIPKFVVIVDEFPRTLSGKVQKFKFLEIFGDKIKKLNE
jgi:fatty-acyl-CoA synthase